MNALSFRGVSLAVGPYTILNQINFIVHQSEFIGVLGPNGSGKTTLMRAILGLTSPSQGAINVLGQRASRGNPMVGYMPQMQTFPAAARLSGWDFVATVLHGHRLGLPILRRSDRAEIDRVLALVDAHSLSKKPLTDLSVGERQRLFLAQALVGNPKLLLLDEPLSGLDPRHQHEVVSLVHRVRNELGIAVLLSAHDINPMLNVLDRVLYLGSGHAAIGTVNEVINPLVLSQLYRADIEVLNLRGRLFVMSGGQPVEHDVH